MSDNDDNHPDGLALAAGITEEHINNLLAKYDEFNNLILLLYRVNDFQPREKWMQSILSSRECDDFINQLRTVIEDYEREG